MRARNTPLVILALLLAGALFWRDDTTRRLVVEPDARIKNAKAVPRK